MTVTRPQSIPAVPKFQEYEESSVIAKSFDPQQQRYGGGMNFDMPYTNTPSFTNPWSSAPSQTHSIYASAHQHLSPNLGLVSFGTELRNSDDLYKAIVPSPPPTLYSTHSLIPYDQTTSPPDEATFASAPYITNSKELEPLWNVKIPQIKMPEPPPTRTNKDERKGVTGITKFEAPAIQSIAKILIKIVKTALDTKRPPTPDINGRGGVKGILNGQDVRAFGDTGASQNIISSRLAKEMGLKTTGQVDWLIEEESHIGQDTKQPPPPYTNGRRGVKGIINGRDVWAFGDTGAGQNIISSRRAKEMGLKTRHQPTLLRMGNSKQILSPGTVRFPWTFPDDPLNVINLTAYVLDNFKYDYLLGNPFLRFTQLMTKHLDRFVKGVFPSHNLWSLNLLGENSQRVYGYLGSNVPMEALADIGSSRNVMDAKWAESNRFTIRTAPKNRGLIVFPDNSTRATIGQVHTTITLPGGRTIPIVFEVLPDCYVDVVLGEDFVFDNNVFANHADAMYEAEGVDSTFDLLPMDYKEFSLGRIGSSGWLSWRSKEKRNDKSATKGFREREEVKRENEWDSKYQQGRTAPKAEWDAENRRRIEHEKRLFPTWQPDEHTCLIKHRSSDEETDLASDLTTTSTSDNSQSSSSSQIPPALDLHHHHYQEPPPSSGEFGAEEASFWGS